jgi:hypothetical protein
VTGRRTAMRTMAMRMRTPPNRWRKPASLDERIVPPR